MVPWLQPASPDDAVSHMEERVIYGLDKSIPGITGCFINLTVNSTSTSGNTHPFVTTWYFNQVNDTQINVAWTNLGTVYENIPTSVNYVAFV